MTDGHRDWATTRSGLFVPAENLVPKIQTPGEQAPRAQRLQVWTAFLAAVFAIPTFLMSWASFREQQTMTRNQMEINDAMKERLAKRFASRVAYWDILSDPDGSSDEDGAPAARPVIVNLQNRSTVSLYDVEIVHVSDPIRTFSPPIETTYIVEVDVIPPCTTIAIDIPLGSLDVVGVEPAPEWRTDSIRFRDPAQWWLMDAHGLRSHTSPKMVLNRARTETGKLYSVTPGIYPDPAPGGAVALPVSITSQPAFDCGESV